MYSAHDHEILLYTVNLKEQKISFLTQHQTINNIKKFELIFTEVFAYYFENELRGSIILDIDQHDIKSLIHSYGDMFMDKKGYCWPTIFNNLEELQRKIKDGRFNYYAISASYGLSGWIVARDFQIIDYT